MATAIAAGGCARTLPEEPATAALYRDLDRIVGVAETTGWYIDRVELNSIQVDTLLSVCAADPASREALLAWLDARIARMGGPIKEAYRERGKKISAIKELLHQHRIRMALARGMKTADEDCPFWIEPSASFRGRQISDDRWHLSLGGGGKGILVSQSGEADVHFGGAGRLLFGRSFGDRISLYLGAEAGGNAQFPKDDMGERSNVVFGLDLVAPVVMRYTLVNGYWELEAGPLATINEVDRELIPGLHVGVSVGGRATKTRWFFPGAAFGVSYERTFPGEMQGDPVTTIKVGFRVAFDVDL